MNLTSVAFASGLMSFVSKSPSTKIVLACVWTSEVSRPPSPRVTYKVTMGID